jgi:integrase
MKKRYRIRRRKNRVGYSWQLDAGMIGEKRFQRSFPTREDAQTAWNELQRTLQREGSDAFALPAAERARMVEAARKLKSIGATIEQAVDFYMRHAAAVTEKITVEQLVERGLAAKADEVSKGAIRPEYVGTLRVVWNGFCAGRETLAVSDVTKKTVEQWLKGADWSGKTQRNYLGDLSNLFAWAMRENLASFNPCSQVRISTAANETPIESLAPDQVRDLFALAVSERARKGERAGDAPFSELIAYLALAVFCGVRPKEIERAKIGDLQLDQGVFVVDAAKSKTRQRRVVTLPAAAREWLTLWCGLHPDAVRICPTNHERLLRAFKRRAGYPKWPHDVLRHTAATMILAASGDERLVKMELGHSKSEDTLHRHYKAVRMLNGRAVTKQAAEEFFAITPSSIGKSRKGKP